MDGMSGASINCPSPAKAAKQFPFVELICRYVVGVIFLMAAVSKIVNLREFESQVLLHSNLTHALARMVPGPDVQMSFSLARIIVAVLPWLELTCGLCLVFRRAVREAAFITAFLLILFIAQSFAFRNEDCHCFFFPAVVSSLPWWWHPIRDCMLLICSAYLFWRERPRNAESR
jgi:uncharacterized membrane protein YphA (DoxX/SURF4 family)